MFQLQYQKQVLLIRVWWAQFLLCSDALDYPQRTGCSLRHCRWCFLVYFICWASDLYSFCSSFHHLATLNSRRINKTAVSICITFLLASAHMLTWWNEEQFRCFKAISFIFTKKKKCSHRDRLNTASIKTQIRGCLQLERLLTSDCCCNLLMCSR